jgi:hypothetical protein
MMQKAMTMSEKSARESSKEMRREEEEEDKSITRRKFCEKEGGERGRT